MGIKDFFKRLFNGNDNIKTESPDISSYIDNKINYNVQDEISSVSKYVYKMLGDFDLLDDLRRYKDNLDDNFPSMKMLEFCFVPFQKTNNFNKLELKYQSVSGNSIYERMLSKYNNNVINDNYEYARAALYLKNKIYNNEYLKFFDNEVSRFEIIDELYNTLMNNNKIEKNSDIKQYYAFLFVLYYLENENLSSIGDSLLEEYDIDVEEDDETIIKLLFDAGCPDDEMWFALYATRCMDNGDLVIYSVEMDDIDEYIERKLKELNRRKKVINIMNKDEEDENSITIDDIDLMSGEQFEDFVVDLFKAMKYKTTHTKLSGDQGIDVIAEKGNSKVAIQAKCYTGTVGNHAIMEAVAGAKHYGATKCMVVTNSTFTKSSKELAESNNVVLWDRKILKEKINQYM